MSDQIIQAMHSSVEELLDRPVLREKRGLASDLSSRMMWLRVLGGHIGPGHPWPARLRRRDRFAVVANEELLAARGLAAVQVAPDPDWPGRQVQGDYAVVDLDSAKRYDPEHHGLYVVRLGGEGRIRYVRPDGDYVWLSGLASGEARARSELLNGRQLREVVQGRVMAAPPAAGLLLSDAPEQPARSYARAASR